MSGTAVEICARVRVRIDLVKGTRLARPWYETPTSWMAWGTAPDLEDAVRLMEAFLLVTARGDVRIGQSARCGIDQTVRVLFPKVARP